MFTEEKKEDQTSSGMTRREVLIRKPLSVLQNRATGIDKNKQYTKGIHILVAWYRFQIFN